MIKLIIKKTNLLFFKFLLKIEMTYKICIDLSAYLIHIYSFKGKFGYNVCGDSYIWMENR